MASGCKREPPTPALRTVEEVGGYGVIIGSSKGGSWPWRIIDEGQIGRLEMLNRSDGGYK